jgi:glutaredoxin-related protein
MAAAGYANTDKMKAIELFNKTLAIDPENGYAKQSVEMLKDKKYNIYDVMKTDS